MVNMSRSTFLIQQDRKSIQPWENNTVELARDFCVYLISQNDVRLKKHRYSGMQIRQLDLLLVSAALYKHNPPFFFRNALTTNLMHVTAIQATPEVAFRKLPSIEFFMFYQIKNKSD